MYNIQIITGPLQVSTLSATVIIRKKWHYICHHRMEFCLIVLKSLLLLGNTSLDVIKGLPQEEMGEFMDHTNYLVTFIFEGIVLLIVALVGLVGNLASFITILSQKVQKTFHSLLFLLSIFDMVRNWRENQFPQGK